MTILWRLEGQPSADTAAGFNDVKAGGYYENAVAWAVKNGIVNGYSASKFGPDDSITREQMAAILYRYAQYDNIDTDILSDADGASVTEYAVPAVKWACGAGLIQGSNGKLMPSGSTTRAQAAAILKRFCENLA